MNKICFIEINDDFRFRLITFKTNCDYSHDTFQNIINENGIVFYEEMVAYLNNLDFKIFDIKVYSSNEDLKNKNLDDYIVIKGKINILK
jgi:hypothetical protein